MAALRPPGLGPIVGHTSDTTCRIWIRAADPGDDKAILDENRRTFGVIGMVSANGRIGRAWYFRLQREYDRTGVFLVGKDVQLGHYESDFIEPGEPKDTPIPKAAQAEALEPDRQYKVRVGTLTLDDPLPNAETLPDWEAIKLLPNIDSVKNDLLGLPADSSEASFRTFPSAATVVDSFSFMIGSCRYPGLLWKIKEADRIFGPMQEHLDDGGPFGAPARLTMMCGDQIYADTLNKNIPILLADKYEEFQERYLSAFGAPNLRTLMRNVTTYMILDDHEIEDNWTQDRLHDTGKHLLFNNAISAYMSYQWSHGPRTFGRRLYYNFECGGYPFFVLDTRTQRYQDGDGLADNHLLGRPGIDPAYKGQLQELLDWLSQKQTASSNIPKFIVSSSVFVPNAMDERLDPLSNNADLYSANAKRRNRSDSWPAFPNTRRAILEHIVREKIQNVVFLSGDIHSANVAELDFRDSAAATAKRIKAFSVTSSAFYWPFPFADGDPNGYVHDSRAPGQNDSFPLSNVKAVMQYKAYGFTQEDNFTRLDVDRATSSIVIRVFDRKGKIVQVSGPTGSTELNQSNTLHLEPW